MRVYEGQRSDKIAIRRTREQKINILAQLRDEIISLRPTAAQALRESIARRILELEAELGDAAATVVKAVAPVAARGDGVDAPAANAAPRILARKA
jgi:hypothetical protein